MKTVDVHIFSPGTQTSAQGVTREFTKADLQQVVDSYRPNVHEAPLRLGHEDNDKVPSWGWVKGVKLKGDDLYAEVEFTPQMGQFVKDGLYKKVSASFYAPESNINPDPGKWSLRHVAMLGAQPPAVKGLKGFAYSEGEQTFDFASATGEVKLSPDQVFDDELGPTLKTEESPLHYLKNSIEEARKEMAAEEKAKADAQELMDDEELAVTDEQETEFAEGDKKKKKAPAGEQGAEDAEEEVSEDEGEDTMDNKELPDFIKKNMKKKEDKEDDTSDNKEKKMDPVGQEDGDIDNDGDKDSSDEYLAKRRKAIGKAMKEDESKNSEEDTADHAGCGNHGEKYEEEDQKPKSKKVGMNYGSMKYSEISVPEGVDAAQFEAGFKDAVDKFYTGVENGADEVLHQETEDQTVDYLSGIEAGFEFAQAQLNRIGSDSIGSAKHDDKCCDTDEEGEGEGPVASKVKKQKTGEPESTVEKENNYGEVVKRGKDGEKTTEFNDNSEDEDEALHKEDGGVSKALKANGGEDFGRDELGKAKSTDASGRKQKGVGKKGEHDDESFNAKGTAPEEDRAKKGVGTPANRKKTGKGGDTQKVDGVTYKSLGADKQGSGKQIKSPAVRVLKFSEAQFSELSERLEHLEAMNAKLVAEKQAAEAKAHRLQLEEFAESLYATGRLTEATIDQDDLVNYMEGLENGTLEFSEGETPATKLMELLASLPAQVSFSEIAPHNTDEVPEESLDPHERALRMSQEEGMSYAEALKVTLFTAE